MATNDAEVLDVNVMSVDELKTKLEELGKVLTGSKAVLRERLRGALEDIEETNDEINVDSLSKHELITRLRELSLKVTGNKPELRTRLKAALEIADNPSENELENSDGEDEEEEDLQDEEDEEEEETAARRMDRPKKLSSHPTLTFKDVEDSLETFSGDGSQNFKRWVANFEETAELCAWTDVQTVIYAKRLLRGSAKLFTNFECQAKSWKKLKKALTEEFSSTINSKQVHRELSLIKKKPNETYQEYIYRVLEMASHADIELEAKIQYIIDGVPDNEANKSILYGASTIKELRKKFSYYEAQASRSKQIDSSSKQKQSGNGKPNQGSQPAGNKQSRRCYNCGDKKHLGDECPNKSNGRKCFSCDEYGHIAPNCPKKKASSKDEKKTRCDAVSTGDKKVYKMVSVMGQQVEAVIDSGSDLHLAPSSFYVKLGAPPLLHNPIPFGVVGIGENGTLGSFDLEVIVDKMKVNLQVHVVPDSFLDHALLIGGQLSDLVEVRLKRREASCFKLEDDTTEDSGAGGSSTEISIREVMNVNILHESPEYNNLTHHLTDLTFKTKVEELIQNYKPNKTEDTGIKMRIILTDDVPVHQSPRRLSAINNEKVNKIISTWKENGIVKESVSEYASPIVLVERKNGEPRICVDYRLLNKKIVRDRYPMPLIEDLLDKLQAATVFSTLDLQDGFFHVSLEEGSTKYTAIVVPDGQFEFLRVPMGLCNSPAVFQRNIREIFRTLIANGTVLSYLDDLIIPAKSEEENLEKLQQVLELASKHGLIINWNKCHVLVRMVQYLGYIVEKGTIRPSEEKTRAVLHFPKPASTKDIQSFLGLTGHFRKFIAGYAMIARPLSNLLRDGVNFEFGPSQEQAFDKLKTLMAQEPILKLYRVGAETELHTDASMVGLGAILFQKDLDDNLFHPIYFASWKTTPAEEKYTSYELEILAVIKALKKFRIYLLGIPIKIVTDCRAFVQTMSKKETCLRVSRWALQIEEFQYTIEHRPGTSMRHVDTLSRYPTIYFIQERSDGLISQIQKAQEEDPELQRIFKAVGEKTREDFILRRNILYKEDEGNFLLVVPSSMQAEVIKQEHEKAHFGTRKMEYALRQEFWFPGMRSKILKFINNCVKCILTERKRGKQEGFLSPIDKGTKPLDTLHVDHLGPIPSTKKRYQHLLVVTDAFTKFSWIYPTRSTTTDEVVERLKKQAAVFGNPRRIVADRGTAFTSNAFREYCQDEGIHLQHITTGVPRGNGQVERTNEIIIPVLTKLAMPNPADWYKYVDMVQQHLNSSYSRSIGMTPFELMVGSNMKLKDDPEIRLHLEEELISAFRRDRSALRDEAISNIMKIQKENKKTADRGRKTATKYREEDLVAILRTQQGPGMKCHPDFVGPYKIVSILRHDRYLVEKIGEYDGPFRTSTSADHMKPWPSRRNPDFNSDFEEYDDNSSEE